MSNTLGRAVALAAALALFLPAPGSAFGRKERKAAALEESAKPRPVRGGEMFEAALAYEDAFQHILNYFKKNDYVIDEADGEIGQIFTGIEIAGKRRQTGTRVQVTLIKEADTATTVKLAVTKQKRYKVLQTEPWSDPKLDPEESKDLATKLEAYLLRASPSEPEP